MKVQRGDLVHIRWEDHYCYGRGGWRDSHKVDISPLICETVGWVVAQDKERLATAAGHDGQMPNPSINGHVNVCPKNMIKSLRIIKKGIPAQWKEK